MKRDISERIEEVKSRICEMQGELADLEQREREKISKKFKLPFQKSFRYTTEVTVDLPLPLSKERRTFRLHGQKTFEFSKSEHPGIAQLRIVDDRFTMEAVSLMVDRFLGFLHKILKVPRTTFQAEAIYYKTLGGHVDLATGYYAIQFAMRLTPKAVPVLSLIGIDELPLLIEESGRLDFKAGGKISAAGRVEMSPGHKGPLNIRAFYDKGDTCPTTVSICGTVDGLRCSEKQQIYVAPGDDVHLWFTSSPDVPLTGARLEPGLGPVDPNAGFLVQPQATAPNTSITYTIIAKGACERQDSVPVRVVQEGEWVELTARLSVEKDFRIEIPPQFCSPRLQVSMIKPVCISGCFQDPAIVGNPALQFLMITCPGWKCHGTWNGMKIDPSGQSHNFNVTPGQTPLGYFPLAGLWRFTPAYSKPPYNGVAYFWVQIHIKE
jgi:hypothetical protein